MTVKKFVRIVWTVFAKIKKNPKMAIFCSILDCFWPCFSSPNHTIVMPLRRLGPFGCRMTVQIFMKRKIVWTIFEKVETFIERSEKKITTLLIAQVVESFFPTPKN